MRSQGDVLQRSGDIKALYCGSSVLYRNYIKILCELTYEEN